MPIPDNVKNLFKDVNNCDIPYCHWKSNEHLLKGLVGGTDLDILVDIKQQKSFELLLVQNGYHRVISHPWNTYDFVSDWIGADSSHGQQIHIHLHYKLITGKQNLKEQYLPWTELVLQNKVFNSEFNVWICNPNIEILIFITRILLKRFDFIIIPNNLKKYKLGNPNEQELSFLRAQIQYEEIKRFAQLMFPEALQNDMIKLALNADAWNNKNCKKVKKDLVRYLKSFRNRGVIVTNIQSFYRYAIQMTCYKIGHGINKKKKVAGQGKLISFLGVDGSGKTTVAKDLQKWLSWKIDCRYVYLGVGQGKSSLLNRLVRYRAEKKLSARNGQGKKLADSSSLKKSDERDNGFKKALRRTLLNIVAYSNIKYKYKTVINIKRLTKKGVIVLTDRFPQNQYLGINDGANIKKTGNKPLDVINKYLSTQEDRILKKILKYHPDVIIKLIIPFEISRDRKQDSPADTIRKKIEIVDKLHYEGAKEFRVRSDQTIEETEDEIKRIIWDSI